jgi:putative transport protein
MPVLELLAQNPILLLFVVAAIGYPLGRIKIAGISLGVAAVLFAGLGIGSLSSEIKLPEVIYQFGLVLFVYTIGLSSGPGFFAALKRRGLRDNLLVVGLLVAAGSLVVLAKLLLGLPATLTAGLFTGAFTNTPALAGVLETIKATANTANLERLIAEPVVAYSVAYPMGVVAMLLSIALLERLWRIDYALETKRVPHFAGTGDGLTHQSVVVTSQEFQDQPITQVAHARGWNVVLGRVQHAGSMSLVSPETKLEPGDVVSVIGHPSVVQEVTSAIGEPSSEALEADRRTMDFRRMVVSNPKIAGKKLAQLQLPQQFGALVTRVGRGDVDLLPSGNTVLELGDRVRIVSPAGRMSEVSSLLGDSYRAIAEIDVMTFGIGIALGLLLGSIPIPFPGGTSFKLGFAGGPLIVGLILGALGRTGPILWQLPHGANLTLRQLGLILFLAGVGTRSGYAFASTLSSGGGLALFLAGMAVTTIIAMMTLWIGYQILKIPFPLLTGLLAGLQTQPAVLGFASERAGNDLPNVGYATVYPVATISKIVIAQLLLTLLS